MYTLGTVAKLRGDWELSERYYEQSRRIAEGNDDTYLLAFAWRALGEVYAVRGKVPQADAAFGQAMELFQRLNIAEEVRQTEQLAGKHDAKITKRDA